MFSCKSAKTARLLKKPAIQAHLLSPKKVLSGCSQASVPLGRTSGKNSAFGNGDFDTGDTGQILIPVMQMALTALLKSKGVYPCAVIGYSVGEIAAAVAAGAITASEGLTIACRCAMLHKKIRGKGAMVIVKSPQVDGISAFEQVTATLQNRKDIGACLDLSPADCVVSGHGDAIKDFCKEWEDRADKLTFLDTDVPFHSPPVRPHEARLRDTLTGIALQPNPSINPVYSTSSENPRSEDLHNSTYWLNNTLYPVRLTTAVKAAAEDGYRTYLEVSPHPVITHFVKTTLSTILSLEERCLVLPSMIRDKNATEALVQCVARMLKSSVTMHLTDASTGDAWVDGIAKFMKTIKTSETVGGWDNSEDTSSKTG